MLIADDHAAVREGIASIINLAPDLLVVAEAGDGDEAVALALARSVRPDIAILDVSMPRMNGMAAARRITAELPDIKIIGLSIYDDEGTVRAMKEAGAVGYVTKDAPAEELRASIRRTLAGSGSLEEG